MPPNKATRKRAAKRKPAKRTPAPAVAPEIVDQTIALLLALESNTEVTAALTSDKLGLDPAAAEAAIAEAKRHLAIKAGTDRTLELGRTKARLDNLYRRSVQAQDCKTALAALRELIRLLALGSPAPIGAAAQATSAADPAAHDDAARAREHLAMAFPGLDAPLDELARMAAAELIDTRNAAPL